MREAAVPVLTTWQNFYILIVLRRARRQTYYQPVLEDWLWHTILPLVSYTALVVAVLLLLGHPATALFVIAAGTVLLLFIGIHNAWDNVSYLPCHRTHRAGEQEPGLVVIK